MSNVAAQAPAAPSGTASAPSSTDRARQETLLSPRFYRTDYAALNRLDVTPVRREWDEMMAEFERDENRAHFRQEVDFDAEGVNIPEDLRDDFLDFLVTSVTSEYSGCVLYQEIQKNVDNRDIADLCGYMARDESRHAGFINRCLKHLGMAVDLGFLKREKEYTFFKPKYIFYATYLSEKIGYARYITIFRHLEKHPEYRFHPIFRWFQEWCNDEFRHGEAFALIMRAHPELLRGHNRLWIRFFLLAVYATMYVRDHSRPRLYQALGIDPTEYDYQVFDICTEITRQIFPITLDTDNPKFREGLETLRRISEASDALGQRRDPISLARRGWLKLRGGLVFARLYLLPVNSNELPSTVRMQPAW